MIDRALLLLLLLALLGFAPSAFAACSWSGRTVHCATRPEAYTALTAYGEQLKAEFEQANPGMTGSYCFLPTGQPNSVWLIMTNGGRECVQSNVNGTGMWTAECAGTGEVWNPSMEQCQQNCQTMQPITTGFTPPNGSIRCNAGCDVVYNYNGDGTSTATPTGGMCALSNQQQQCAQMQGYYWHPNLNACVPMKPEDCDPAVQAKEGVCRPPEECPEGMITDANGLCAPKGNECPAGQIKSPEGSCLPGDGQCAAGEARGGDGTCKPDKDNDGQADEEDDDPTNDPEKNSFSGGDGCNNPPSCSGDPIMCGQARIQWRIECNTRRQVNIAGGSCEAVPICTGEKCNAMEYAQLLQQWRTSCAVQALVAKSGTGGGTPGDANGNGQPDWTENPGNGDHDTGGEGNAGDAFGEQQEIGADGLDTSGFGWGSSCPSIPQVSINGRTIAFDTSKFCEWIHLGGAFVLIIAGLVSLRIIGGAV